MPDSNPSSRSVVGRAAGIRPANRFEKTHAVADYEQLADDDELFAPRQTIATQYLPDQSKTLIRENDSPDVGFRYSVNPYRGCEHGCVYCYARPGHETLGFDAGLDFETRILVKHDAPALLRRELARKSWQGDVLAMSGVTDCYQPIERELRLTRGLLVVMLEARQPVGIVTKNAGILRDLDIVGPMAALGLIQVNISVTTLDAELARTMEPRTATPAARLRAIRELSAAGVPTRVMVSPIIPGLTDEEIPAILQAAAEAGARSAGYILLRLPLAVAPIFEDWLARQFPDRREKTLARIRDTRAGKLNDATFGRRMRGAGAYAEQLLQTFKVFAKKHGLDGPLPELNSSLFQPPSDEQGQMSLF